MRSMPLQTGMNHLVQRYNESFDFSGKSLNIVGKGFDETWIDGLGDHDVLITANQGETIGRLVLD